MRRNHYLWRRYLVRMPIQPCLVCGRWFWAGMLGSNEDYCSQDCCDFDLEQGIWE